MRRLFVFAVVCCLLSFPLAAQEAEEENRLGEEITVTASKVPEDVTIVPESITVLDGEDLRARNATDLASALATVSGVSIAPGGDAGPAGSVPEMWGLREFDAFLLVVDGVPWGGAFNPDTPTIDMENVDRVEILRGAAPVMYGATSFVGVIHVIHREAGAPGNARLSLGSHKSGVAAVTVPLSQDFAHRQSLTASFEKRGFRDEKSGFDRAHLLYRFASQLSNGTLRFDADGVMLRQDPASPHLREGGSLSSETPLDANYNPRDAKIDTDRLQGTVRWDGSVLSLPTTALLSLAHSKTDTTRGFLEEIDGDTVHAAGYDQARSITDSYFDVHVIKAFGPTLRIIGGLDHLFGRASAASEPFDYTVPLAGGRPSEKMPSDEEENAFRERRNFTGLYATTEWNATPKLRIDAGLRLNRTAQNKSTDEETNRRNNTRFSGSVGADYVVYNYNHNKVALFADYRNTFKPAATDFGPDVEPDVLEPEDAISYEVGAKGALGEGRMKWQASAFRLDFSNLVVSTVRNGLPAIENAGQSRFQGGEVEIDTLLTGDLRWELGYSYHDSRFTDYVRAFDGVPTQLAGHRLEMTPLNLLGTGLMLQPESGPTAYVLANYVGPRYLNMRNTALAGGYVTYSAGAGYRFGHHEIRVDGRNLNDVRPPVAESEVGESQYYRLPARSVDVTWRYSF